MHSWMFEDAKTTNLARYAGVHRPHRFQRPHPRIALRGRSAHLPLPIHCLRHPLLRRLAASAPPLLPLHFFRNDGDCSGHSDGCASGSALTAAISVISEGGGWMPRLAQPVTPDGHHSRERPPPPP